MVPHCKRTYERHIRKICLEKGEGEENLCDGIHILLIKVGCYQTLQLTGCMFNSGSNLISLGE